MDAAETIRQSLSHVSALRAQISASSTLRRSLHAIKQFQARRFAGTYQDLLDSEEFSAPTRFFLEELYGEQDFSERDAQFARIAGALQTFFPAQVVETAKALAQLHAMTESFDLEMAIQCQSLFQAAKCDQELPCSMYIQAWREVGSLAQRKQQLAAVLAMGKDLERLTRTKGLRMSLRLMRAPAKAAGLGNLQIFLEAGFDTFASMNSKAITGFLADIEYRENMWIETLYTASFKDAESQLKHCMLAKRSSDHR